MDRRTFFGTVGAATLAAGLAQSRAGAADSSAEDKLRAMGLSLPEPAGPAAVYVPFRRSGNQVFIAGNIPPLDADIPTVGKAGADLTTEQAYAAAQLAALRVLAQLKVACDGDLDRVEKALQIRGFVNCTADFTEQSSVINGASDLFREVFGDAGLAARALGTNALPLNAVVEIESIWETRD